MQGTKLMISCATRLEVRNDIKSINSDVNEMDYIPEINFIEARGRGWVDVQITRQFYFII